ncbi:MAG: DUF3343 domain-containing protein [Spirochaetaceae bacterium]|jgi:hypothetical protein|nr:DUF3343 domain-containing protein [Spirochaetaceae bacterium]
MERGQPGTSVESGIPELIITFRGSRDAIMGERTLLDSGIDVRVMPMPVQLGPACGIALRISADDIAEAGTLLGETIDGVYCRAGESNGELVPWKR